MKGKRLLQAIVHGSIFRKLLIAIALMAFLIIVFVIVFFRAMYSTHVQEPFAGLLSSYSSLLIQEIGVPPDTVKALEIINPDEVQIRYEGRDLVWSTSDDLPTLAQIKEAGQDSSKASAVFLWPYYVVYNGDGSVFILNWNLGFSEEVHRNVLMVLLILVSLTIIGAYFYIRNVLQPIELLRNRMSEISGGNLDGRLPVQRNDELGKLTETFNDMTQRIQEMLKARDQLLLDVSHELRSPITRIRVALEFIPASEKKGKIAQNLDKVETMITEILESERLANGQSGLLLQNQDIQKIIREVIENLRDSPPGIELNGVARKMLLQIDTARIRIVLQNLLDNAMKYSRSDSKSVQVSVAENEQSVTIQIADDGLGIPEDELPYIFEPFYRVDPSRSKATGGYGLGLSLCKKIMHAHGGGIKIFNNDNGGATVVLTFVRTP